MHVTWKGVVKQAGAHVQCACGAAKLLVVSHEAGTVQVQLGSKCSWAASAIREQVHLLPTAVTMQSSCEPTPLVIGCPAYAVDTMTQCIASRKDLAPNWQRHDTTHPAKVFL